MDGRASMGDLRWTASGHQQANRVYTILPAKSASEFKANQCSEAVAEERKRLVQKWSQSLGEDLDETRKICERTLHQPGTASGELNRTDLNIRRQGI